MGNPPSQRPSLVQLKVISDLYVNALLKVLEDLVVTWVTDDVRHKINS